MEKKKELEKKLKDVTGQLVGNTGTEPTAASKRNPRKGKHQLRVLFYFSVLSIFTNGVPVNCLSVSVCEFITSCLCLCFHVKL